MSEPGLITGYLAALSAQLPAQVVEEMADGLNQTYRHHLGRGLDADAAAAAAIAEFGEPQVILSSFTCASPARSAARRLLATGPVVGACWGAALITGRAWAWPVPAQARILFGAALITVVGLLAAAALGRQYRSVSRAGTAGCVGIAAFDTAMLIAVTLAGPAVAWPLILAVTASAVRIAFTARSLRPVLAG
jgi:hypothetical protein